MGGISRSTLWRLRRAKDFPEPIKLSPGRNAWFRSEYKAWLISRAQNRTA
ncbi:AlpA family phage regulatory protein [Nordella sp. HKS 07]|nr:AlpA family phage regulatory protein [Nordella sp. HKS 07]QIG52535.1 AlpA family phage regulatory protein [Nordella sp. HKS 07]